MDSIELNFHLDMWLILSGTSDPGVIYFCLHYKMEDVDYDWHAVDALAVELRMFATIVCAIFPRGRRTPLERKLNSSFPKAEHSTLGNIYLACLVRIAL